MSEMNRLTEQFEGHRSHLRSVAYRMLGSWSEAEDAVQESWLRLSRSDGNRIENIGGWLTTVVSRVCLDMLRSRKSRREEGMDAHDAERPLDDEAEGDPEREAILADSIGLALHVVLDTLNPEERISFILHDIFAVPYAEIAPIVGRSEIAARQLASRARRRLQGARASSGADLNVQRSLVDSFLAAARKGDFEALLAVLDPQVVLRSDRKDAPNEVRGIREVAAQLMGGRAKAARPALVDGEIGVVVSPGGQLLLVLALAYANGKIAGVDVITDESRLRELELISLSD
ncbi:sigma-70 family RNA polymerase sigma factor [Cohnella thailandensis]|uniref:Sigma-70 family RNA polymerase sigma factor n=1 Tax=Cohnella thailandensis TaxID=557557 RepID=A0A841SP97_9BACL|nr:sigma-70 family RNA polymerase sigma factor [Cohnella thailandensis]MBB6634263.1 sigma-70 family RNA polymerase sigma factor [Cohnella thailandensis]MBP1972239.1 RNA polymerase sigma-70 factor (ECF subfamily) [Cohnella thailandensis]